MRVWTLSNSLIPRLSCCVAGVEREGGELTMVGTGTRCGSRARTPFLAWVKSVRRVRQPRMRDPGNEVEDAFRWDFDKGIIISAWGPLRFKVQNHFTG